MVNNWILIGWVILAFTLIGCGAVVPATVTPTPIQPSFVPSSTAAPESIHYTSEFPEVSLEFDYPGSWIFYEGKYQWGEGVDIYLGDPRLRTAPTRDPNISHSGITDFGTIYIYIRPLENGQTLESLFETQKKIDENTVRGGYLQDYLIEIDGYKAYVLEFLNDVPEAYTSVMFWRTIFLVVEDQSIRIDFMVSVNERNGEFEQGYEYFFNSMRIVP